MPWVYGIPQGVFSPSISCNKNVAVYERYVVNASMSVVDDVKSTLRSFQTLAVSEQIVSRCSMCGSHDRAALTRSFDMPALQGQVLIESQ